MLRIVAFLKRRRRRVQGAPRVPIPLKPAVAQDPLYNRWRAFMNNFTFSQVNRDRGFVLENRLGRIGTPTQGDIVPLAVVYFKTAAPGGAVQVRVFEPDVEYQTVVHETKAEAFLKAYLALNSKLDITCHWFAGYNPR